MDLIEQLGGYEKAKRELQLKEQNSVLQCCITVTAEMIRDALLEYRRQHNIYEVVDKVVIESYRNTYISCGRPSQYSIGDLMVIHNLDGNVISDNDYNFIDYRDVRHATDAEIKAGKRLEVNQ
ncbi:hypothetical protein [Acinetobacter lwoffii]|uniref:hypothetical protein n=1 Tax=Acinetobacter lwoffii TaxID=28090 RepID=UPI0002CDD6DF|nr:hypothetical protein [Acinetobacter lwoffii]ENW29417.1 hypothetical protein F924_00982 [Acinetobacter lwoffii ATCC 9957 = CIP 70.31]